MRKSRAFIAASLCALLASPAPAQVRAVAPVFSGAVPRVMAAPLALTASAPSALLLSEPSLLAAPVPSAVAPTPVAVPVAAVATAALPARAVVPVAAPAVRAAASAARSLPPAPDAGPAAALPAVAPALVPAAVGFKALLVQASPSLEAAAVLVGTYAANRVARWIIGKLALKKGLDRHQIAVARLVIGVVLWSAAAAGAMHLGGAILFEKPFKVGDTLELGSFKGVVEDMTLYHVVVKLDEGRHVLLPYAVVRDAAIIVTPKETHP